MTLLTFRGVDLLTALASPSGLEGKRINVVHGFLLPPSVRGVDVVVPAKPGRTVGTRMADVLALELRGYIASADPTTWRIETDEWLGALDESGVGPGALIASAPYLGLAAGTTATVNARVKNIVEGEIVAGVYQAWSVALESVDPYWVVSGP